MIETERIQVRMTRIELGNETEYLLSNLGEEYTKEELKEIYAKRWKEETAFRTIKHQLKLENFSGVTPRLIEQDVYATLYVYNLIQDCWLEGQKGIKQEKEKAKKQINRNIEIGMWKEEIINIYIMENEEKMTKRMKAFIENIMKYVVSVKEGEHNKRRKEKKPRKYHQNQKNSY